MAKTTSAMRSHPRDAEATRERLFAAATEEFSEYGYAGARIDRIAQRAGTNKRMIYVYFGDKDGLFEAVFERQIVAYTEAVPLTPDDLGAFAVARFDYILANPKVRRLATWRTIERAEPTTAELASYRAKVDAVAAAQCAGRVNASVSALDLYAMVLRLTESWLSAPPALQAVAGDDPLAAERLSEHRAALVAAVRRITEPT
jgi:AcrR family transcriptional regulator